MGVRKIIWTNRAINSYQQIFDWYDIHRGVQFSRKFFHGIIDTIELISNMPTIGTLEPTYNNNTKKYYSFLSHPKYRIVYRYTKTRVYIINIRCTLMKSESKPLL
jgi:plasmid stabilization system protein ParE